MTNPQTGLSARQFAILFAFGVFLWFVVAIGLHAMNGAGLLDGAARWLVYAALVPLTVPLILVMMPLAGLERRQLLAATAVAIGAPSLCDGVALVTMPELYAADPAHTTGAAAAILWGVGVAALEAVWLGRGR